VGVGLNPIDDPLPGCRLLFFLLFLLLVCLVCLLFFSSILGFFVAFVIVGSSDFLFPLEFDPEDLLCLSFFPSWKSSSSQTASRSASIQSLLSAYSSGIPICHKASFGNWSLISFWKAIPVTFALTFQFSNFNRISWCHSYIRLSAFHLGPFLPRGQDRSDI